MSERKSDEPLPCPWCGENPELLYMSITESLFKNAYFGCWNMKCNVRPQVSAYTIANLSADEYEILVNRWNKREGEK